MININNYYVHYYFFIIFLLLLFYLLLLLLDRRLHFLIIINMEENKLFLFSSSRIEHVKRHPLITFALKNQRREAASRFTTKLEKFFCQLITIRHKRPLEIQHGIVSN